MSDFLQKCKDLSQEINVPMAAFAALSLRTVLFGGSYPESIALFALAAIYGWQMFLKGKDVTWKRSVELELAEVKSKVSSLTMKDGMRIQYEQGTKKAKRLF